jgi:hypothetical protein
VSRGVSLAALYLLVAASAAQAEDMSGLFDKPMNVERIPLPKDSLNPQAEPMLSCFHYSGVRVKQIDRGEKGAELFLLPLKAGQPMPECTEAAATGEKPIDDWGGYFKGARGAYVFFDADDGWNSGVGFAIFSAAGEKIFHDVAEEIRTIDAVPSKLVLRYRRVYGAPCSLFADKAGCWNKVKAETALTGDAPDCAAAYEADIRQAAARKDSIAANPTIIAYEAQTVLDGATAVTEPLPGTVACQPAM